MGTKKTYREGFALPFALLKQGALPFFALPKTLSFEFPKRL
jgi:hypothetical protein